MKHLVNQTTLYAGNIMDDSGDLNEKVYKVEAFVTDIYYLGSKQAKVLNLFDENQKLIQEHCLDSQVKLQKGKVYYIQIQTSQANESFMIDLYPLNNKLVTAYEINATTDLNQFNTDDVEDDPLKPAKIEFVQRKGGTYLYSNVPESMPEEALNSIIMQNKNLTGACFLTFEHQNRTGVNGIYMGYRITNIEDHDIYVTVTNIGYQINGSWLGEKSWMDYYGLKFPVNFEAFKKENFIYAGKDYSSIQWFKDYLAFDLNYGPNPIQPTTYKLKPHTHLYVIGGTTKDSYNQINVHQTADQPISLNECMNGNVRFNITNGKVLGELCSYNDIDFINSDKPVVQNLRKYGEKDDFGGRIGYSPIHGVIDNNPVWEFNDLTPNGNLPVTYESYYADQLKDSYEPFENLNGCYNHTKINDKWLTHLSAQLNHDFCGSDMVDIYAVCNGKDIKLSNYVANPRGLVWDYGNWMIEYQENCTFVNKGNHDRIVNFYLVNGSCVLYTFKDMNNHVLHTGATVNVCTDEISIFEYVIPAHSKLTLSMQFVLPANTCGSVKHYIKLSSK